MSLVSPGRGALVADPSANPAGTMMPYAGASAPIGWLICDGASVLVADYPRLHAAIGYAWGGAGANFTLPDMVGRMPIGVGTLGADTYALADTGGAATHTLAEGEVPGHVHSGPSHTHGVGTLVNANQSVSHSHLGNNHTHGATGLTTGSQNNSHTHSDTTDGQSVSHDHALTSQSTGAVDHVHSGGAGTLAQAISGGGTTGSGAIGNQSANHDHAVSTGNQSANHQHAVSGSTAGNNTATGTQSASHAHTISGATAADGTDNTGSTGGGTAHENRPAYAAVNYLIKV